MKMTKKEFKRWDKEVLYLSQQKKKIPVITGHIAIFKPSHTGFATWSLAQ